MRKTSLVRLVLFVAVAVFHLLLILFFAVTMDTVITAKEPPVAVMKLADFEEEIPPPPPPPPEPPPPVQENAVESIAENMIETEEVPEDQTIADPGTLILPPAPVQAAEGEEEYLPMHRISVLPVFSERDILADLVYPPIALRSGIEGTVYLELFVDHRGEVRQITVLREIPPNRGFGEAAASVFQGRKGKPGEANGVPVGVRYRYPVRFTIKG